jgi:hypothetical protein
MIMIRNTMFGLSLMALTAGSAFAAPVKHHVVRTVAAAPATDTATPPADGAAKPEKKAHKAKKAPKADAPKADAKAPTPAPAPETK